MGVPLPTGQVQDLPNCLKYITWPGHPQQHGANATHGPYGNAALCLGCLRWLRPVPVSRRYFCHPCTHCSSSILEELLQLHLGGVLFLLPVILVEEPLEDIPSSGLLISSLSLFPIDLHTNVSPGTNIFCLKSCLPFWLHPGRSLQQLRCSV